jgi:hypothetical protein
VANQISKEGKNRPGSDQIHCQNEDNCLSLSP